MITIQRRTLRKIAWFGILALVLASLAIVVSYFMRVPRDYLHASYVRYLVEDTQEEKLVGKQVRVRGYLGVSGNFQTIDTCDTPEETYTQFSLEGIELMECEVNQCAMTCPLFKPNVVTGAYEIVGTLAYCEGERLCLTDISEIYQLEQYTIGLKEAVEVPITPGPVSFTVGEQWELP